MRFSLHWTASAFALALLTPITGCAASPDKALIASIEAGDRAGVEAALLRKPNLEPRCEPNAVCKPLARAASMGRLDLVQLLIAAGADPNGLNAYGDTAFVVADNASTKGASDARIREIRMYLLAHGVDPNLPNQFNATPTAGAAAAGDLEMLAECVARGGRINPPSGPIYPPLMAAAQFGQLPALEWLLDHDADPRLTFEGKTARDMAVKGGHAAIAARLDRAAAR
jgi:ankyrin repeat protein